MRPLLALCLLLCSTFAAAAESAVPGLEAYRTTMAKRIAAAPDQATKDALMRQVEALTVKWAKSVDARPASPKPGEDQQSVVGVNDWMAVYLHNVADLKAEEHPSFTRAMAKAIIDGWPSFTDPIRDYVKYKGTPPAWPAE